jgi:hypothetical protein
MLTTQDLGRARVNLKALAAELTRQDQGGHHWDEEDARGWLQRTGSGLRSGGPEGATGSPAGIARIPAGATADDTAS